MAKTIIEATNIGDFFRLVDKLPPIPVGPVKGPCEENMFKQKRGAAVVPVCKGGCEKGRCGIVISVTKEMIRAECVCD